MEQDNPLFKDLNSQQNKKVVETPLMKQYYSIKSKHPDAILLFRMGDFFETFGEDAIITSGILGITLTKRANGAAASVELAGFPHHALDSYLPKLVRAGKRVAICEQLEDPKYAKTIVKRGVVELVTPGVYLNDSVIEKKENNFLASIYIGKQIFGISFLDITTGEFLLSQGNKQYTEKLLQSFNPKEVLYEKNQKNLFFDTFKDIKSSYGLDDWVFTEDNAREKLLTHFQAQSLKGFGIDNLTAGIIAAGSIIDYLNFTEHKNREHIKTLSRIDEDLYMWLDKFTIKNLEIFQSSYEGGKSLINVIDETISPMGGRLLRRWLGLPLKDVEQINRRLNTVEFLINNSDVSSNLQNEISKIGDLERLVSKVAVLKISPREIIQLKRSLDAIVPIIDICSSKEIAHNAEEMSIIEEIGKKLHPCEEIRAKIEKELIDDSFTNAKTGIIASGVSEQLDELRKMTSESKEYLEDLVKKEIEKTGISSLKLSFNNVFGYYLEVRNTYKNRVPEDWIRKQTLVQAERYITPELKKYEDKILGAEENMAYIENIIFNELISAISKYIVQIQENANLIAQLDCLLSFASVAIKNKYSKPIINQSNIIDIKEGRHPVIEQRMGFGEEYISNDLYLDDKTQQIMMITGPNMSGKSALLRQTALICILAQTGCYVPAKLAQIGIVDKVFTRVGASDNISMGESTFMVEMIEAASIMNNISNKSLILLDELGRGTSTYDGISIAWAIAEYIHEHPNAKAKTLFATHYHELNEMEKSYSRIRNYHVSVKETADKVIFLRKLQPGGSEHSFGIHVAQMAGMPKSIVYRANKILEQLENTAGRTTQSSNADKLASGQIDENATFNEISTKGNKSLGVVKNIENIAENRQGYQLKFFQLDDPLLFQIRKEIEGINIDLLTPLEALNKLNEIKRQLGIKN